jgi:hypothetical protein
MELEEAKKKVVELEEEKGKVNEINLALSEQIEKMGEEIT